MKVIYFSNYEGDLGEAQAMFNDDGTLLDYWCSNDGNWRGEYFDGFLRNLGIQVDYSGQYDKEFEKILEKDNS